MADHRPALTDAGFTVHRYDETPHREDRQRETDRLLLEAVDELSVAERR